MRLSTLFDKNFPSPCLVAADLVNSNSGMIHDGGAG